MTSRVHEALALVLHVVPCYFLLPPLPAPPLLLLQVSHIEGQEAEKAEKAEKGRDETPGVITRGKLRRRARPWRKK